MLCAALVLRWASGRGSGRDLVARTYHGTIGRRQRNPPRATALAASTRLRGPAPSDPFRRSSDPSRPRPAGCRWPGRRSPLAGRRENSGKGEGPAGRDAGQGEDRTRNSLSSCRTRANRPGADCSKIRLRRVVSAGNFGSCTYAYSRGCVAGPRSDTARTSPDPTSTEPCRSALRKLAASWVSHSEGRRPLSAVLSPLAVDLPESKMACWRVGASESSFTRVRRATT